MSGVQRLTVDGSVFDLFANKSIAVRETVPGPPQRIDGFSVGIVRMHEDAPHGGELHPDGDELLYLFSGRARITWESEPDAFLELGPGEGCIVPRGEWHRVHIIEPVELLHITPGPNGDHRPLPET